MDKSRERGGEDWSGQEIRVDLLIVRESPVGDAFWTAGVFTEMLEKTDQKIRVLRRQNNTICEAVGNIDNITQVVIDQYGELEHIGARQAKGYDGWAFWARCSTACQGYSARWPIG